MLALASPVRLNSLSVKSVTSFAVPRASMHAKERPEGGVERRHQTRVRGQQVLVVVEAAHAGKEDLPVHAERPVHRHDAGHLGQLLPQAAVGKRDGQARVRPPARVDLLHRPDRVW